MKFLTRKIIFIIIFFYISQSVNSQNIFEKIVISGDANIEKEIMLSNNKTIVTYNINNFIKNKILNSNYSFININQFSFDNTPGKPKLPCKTEIIGLISESTNLQVNIEESTFIEFDGYNILPNNTYAFDNNFSPKSRLIIDSSIYNKNEFYPKEIVKINDLQFYKNFPIAFITTYPVQFNPITKKIRVYNKIVYSIPTQIDFKNKISKSSYEYLVSTISNKDILKNIELLDDSRSKYLILVNNSLKKTADSIAIWKTQLGYETAIISKSNWNSNLVKKVISDYYFFNNDLEFVLLIGDHDGENAIPSIYSSFNNVSHITDLYYSCINGSGDYIPDIKTGRISTNNYANSINIINKIIEYEKNPVNDSNYYKNITNYSYFQDLDTNKCEDRRFVLTSEEIINYLNIKNKYKTNRIYNTENKINPLFYNNGDFANSEPLPDFLKKPIFKWTGNTNDVIEKFNQGSFLAVYRGHGMINGWDNPRFTSENLANLNINKKYPVIFSNTCLSGKFDYDECFSEKIMNSNNGASGIIAATAPSLTGHNCMITLGMIDAIWPGITIKNTGSEGIPNPILPNHNPIYNLGGIMHHGLSTMVKAWGGEIVALKYQYEIYHYFGDPSMKIWTENPHENLIIATHNNSISCNDTVFEISNINIDSTLAVLSFKDTIVAKSIISINNKKINFILPYYVDNLTLTISKTNHIPYSSNISVINNNCNYPPIIDTAFIEEISYNNTKFISKLITDGGSPIESSGIILGYKPDISLQNNINIFNANNSKNNQFLTIANNLFPDTKYFAKAYAKNKNGVVYSDIIEFKTTCFVYDTFPKILSFDSLNTPECWHIYDLQGNGQVWKIGRMNETIPLEGNYIYLNSEAFGANNYQNTDFETPSLDFTNFISPKISFKHYLRHYSYSEEKFFVSTDDGLNWSLVKSWNTNVLTPEICTFTFDSLSNKKNIKFKWNYKAKWSWFWCIDDIKIEGSVIGIEDITNKNKELLIYPNPNNGIVNVIFTSFDKNLNVEILDLNSKIVFNKDIDYQNNNIYNIQLDLKSLHKGIYVIKVNGLKTNLYKKLIINE